MDHENNNETLKINIGNNMLTPKSELSPNRKKVSLGRGFSLMDWIRLTKTEPNLAGNNGIMRKITYDELIKHNKQDDCWLALFDKVYNITPYMKYHPGGIDELMKGAGKNATQIFNDIHPWVNFQNMLEKCLIGVLVGINENNETKKLLPSPLPSSSSLSNAFATTVETSVKIPNLDFYQTNNNVTVIIYTKLKNEIKKENVIIEKQHDSLCVVLYVYILENVYKYIIDFIESVENNYQVKITNDGKIEIIFDKIIKHQWSKMNPKLNYKCELVLYNQTGVNFKECLLINKTQVTHDTSLYTLKLPEHVKMLVPIGYHVFLRLAQEKLLVKPYTVISKSFEDEDDDNYINLMIKHYENGEFTSILNKLCSNSKIEMSNYAGSFNIERLNKCNELILICAGTGLTPMIRIIKSSLKKETIKNIRILFFNKTLGDILWKEKLDELKLKYANKITLFNILSQEVSEKWNGLKGRINRDLLNECVFNKISANDEQLYCICGPKEFNQITLDLLNQLNINSNLIHLFSS